MNYRGASTDIRGYPQSPLEERCLLQCGHAKRERRPTRIDRQQLSAQPDQPPRDYHGGGTGGIFATDLRLCDPLVLGARQHTRGGGAFRGHGAGSSRVSAGVGTLGAESTGTEWCGV